MDYTLELHHAILARIDAGRPFVVALILDAEGSTPCPRGTKAIIDASGAIEGTIGGGTVEAEAQRRAGAVCRGGKPIVLTVPLHGRDAAGATPICGGSVRVLLDPSAPRDRAAYAEAMSLLERREHGTLVTTVTHDPDVMVSVRCFPAGPSELPAPGTDTDVIAEPLEPAPRLLIAGGGHIGQALARHADALGFDVTIIDDRREFADAALFPRGVTARCGEIAAEVAAFPMGSDTYVAIVTRGHAQDGAALAACIRSPAAYIGMIGSRRKIGLMRADFIAAGRASAEEFDRVFAPIGLDIGARTVPEIAASIAAQLVAARRKGSAAARVGAMPREIPPRADP